MRKNALSLGAKGYMTIKSSPAEVLKASNTALKADCYICEEVINRITEAKILQQARISVGLQTAGGW